MPTNRTSIAIKTLAAQGQYGHPRTPRDFYMTPGYCAFYWGHPATGTTQVRWDHMAAVLERYHRLIQWADETLPGWREVSRVHYMDNSVESVQVCRCGAHTRRVMLKPPSGDACF